MTLSMRHATWQQLSHEPRAAINAIVAIRRMHLIAKIKTHSHTQQKTNSKTHKNKNERAQQNMEAEKPQKPQNQHQKPKPENYTRWGAGPSPTT